MLTNYLPILIFLIVATGLALVLLTLGTLLGRFFSVWDIVAYWLAIIAVALLDAFVIRRAVRC